MSVGTIHCATGCSATMATLADPYDDQDVASIRAAGWQVIDGGWVCPDDLPEDRRHLPGAMRRRANPHCTRCGDDRGGPYGHVDRECVWQSEAGGQIWASSVARASRRRP